MREMKNSGIEWIGEIPNNWNIMPNKYLMRKKKVICSVYNNEDIISLSMNGVIVRDLDAGGKMPTSFDGYQYIESGNLLMCLFDIDVTPRCIGLIKNNGLTSPAYSQFELTDLANATYYNYYYTMLDNDKILVHLAKNLRHSLTEEQLGTIATIVPPLHEQQKIADYLDCKCAEIDSLISDIQRQIEILEEYKQSVITETVTKGLDKNAPMKDSGIEWVGDIPEHWNILKIKYFVDSIKKGNGIAKEDVVADGDTPCVRYGEIYSKYNISFCSCISATNSEKIINKQYFSYGDILFAGTGELVEEIGKNIVYLGENRCLAGGDIIVVKHQQNPAFLNYALNCNYSQFQKSCGKAKLKVVHISAFDIGNILVALPNLDEQNEMAKYLDDKIAEINSIIFERKQQIETIEKCKKSLIYECVTGKKEVI